MLWTPLYSNARRQNNLEATPSTTPGTQIAAHASTHTKGSTVSLIDPVAYDSNLLQLIIFGTGATNTRTDMLLDICLEPTGGGTPTVLIPDILAGWLGTYTQSPLHLALPILIPKGVRLSARCQSIISADTVEVVAMVESGAVLPSVAFTGCDAYGINSSGASTGTSHTAGNSGAESTDANIGGTTSRHYRGLLFLPQGTLTDTVMANAAYHFEATIGGVTLAEWYFQTTTSEVTCGLLPLHPVRCSIPSGTQLQVQGECSGTAEPIDVALYAFY